MKKKERKESQVKKHNMTSNYYAIYGEINDIMDCIIRWNVYEVHGKAIFHCR